MSNCYRNPYEPKSVRALAMTHSEKNQAVKGHSRTSRNKGIACWLAALCNKEPNREAMAIGSLMNARGLMELILLNIGLEQGIITPTLFTMLVLMAILTTLMASPFFEWVYGRHQKQPASTEQASIVDLTSVTR